jgi:hypothetical protein
LPIKVRVGAVDHRVDRSVHPAEIFPQLDEVLAAAVIPGPEIDASEIGALGVVKADRKAPIGALGHGAPLAVTGLREGEIGDAPSFAGLNQPHSKATHGAVNLAWKIREEEGLLRQDRGLGELRLVALELARDRYVRAQTLDLRIRAGRSLAFACFQKRVDLLT